MNHILPWVAAAAVAAFAGLILAAVAIATSVWWALATVAAATVLMSGCWAVTSGRALDRLQTARRRVQNGRETRRKAKANAGRNARLDALWSQYRDEFENAPTSAEGEQA